MTPIDEDPPPPPPSGVDRDYLTWDIMTALELGVMELVKARMRAKKIGRREAALEVIRELKALANASGPDRG